MNRSTFTAYRLRSIIVLVLVLLVAVFGVAASPRKTYLKSLEAQTRKLVIYDGFATSLIMRATLLTPAFRDQLAAERRRLGSVSDADHAAFVARNQGDNAKFHEIVFSADSSRPQGKKFGNGDAGWNLRLLVDGVEAPHHETHMIRRPTPMHQGLYTHITLWSDLYITRFERVAEDPREVVLSVGSGFGNGDVTWKLR